MEKTFDIERVRVLSSQAGFNRWAGFEVARAADGEAELTLQWKEEFGQYAGFLHAGMIAALLDTVCGFAATTVSGPVMASHFSVSCLSPAVGQKFVARGRVVKAGKRQIFTRGDLFTAGEGQTQKLVATAEVLMLPA